MWLQFRTPEYRAPVYWFAVMMVAVFGTMAADGIRDGAGIPYSVTTPLFAGIVAATTAAGDLTAYSLNLGFWESAVLFAVAFAVPAIGWWRFHLNPILGFWAAYILTRPLGASFADGFSKPANGALGLGDGVVSGIALITFIALVTYVAVTKRDVQPGRAHHLHVPHPHLEPAAAPRPAES
jgi:uncharacterized membrane-anchored protein